MYIGRNWADIFFIYFPGENGPPSGFLRFIKQRGLFQLQYITSQFSCRSTSLSNIGET